MQHQKDKRREPHQDTRTYMSISISACASICIFINGTYARKQGRKHANAYQTKALQPPFNMFYQGHPGANQGNQGASQCQARDRTAVEPRAPGVEPLGPQNPSRVDPGNRQRTRDRSRVEPGSNQGNQACTRGAPGPPGDQHRTRAKHGTRGRPRKTRTTRYART